MRAAVAAVAVLTAMLAGAPAQAQAQGGDFPDPATRESVGDWVVECFDHPDLAGRCQIYQRILMNNNTEVALVATFAYRDSALHLQVALPLGLDLSRGADLAIGPEYSTTVPITRCTMRGCLLEGQVTDGLLARLTSASAASVTVVNPGRGPFQIPLSLSGYDTALARIAPQAEAADDPEAPEALPETPPDDAEMPDPALRPVTGTERQESLQASPDERR
jgi:invasion protein IalB